jgi:hypothetical protein
LSGFKKYVSGEIMAERVGSLVCLNSGISNSQRSLTSSFQWVLGITMCVSLILVSCGGGSGSPQPSVTLQTISVSPASGTLAAGLTQQFSTTGNYSDGSSKALSSVTWTSSNTALAKINSSGLLTAIKSGAVTVSAMSGSITGTSSFTVGPPNLLSVGVSPQSPTIPSGQTQQFTATGSFSDGSTQDLTSSSMWSSGTVTAATISNSGLATGVAAGTTMIQATSAGISGSTVLTVTAVAQTISYVNGATFSTGGTNPEGIVVADFNGDGKLDLAVSNIGNNTVDVFLNDGSGNFAAPIVTTVQITNGLGSLSVGDFNEDGKADLVVATISGPQANIVLLGNGDGTFRQQAPIPNSFGFFHARVVDLNGDGHQDLVLGSNGGISVSLGRGDGTFIDTVGLPSASFPGTYLGITVADFNGDGKPDIAAIDSGSPTAGVGTLDFYSGNGDGTFATPTSVPLWATFPASLASGDFNADGKQDILIGFPTSGVIAFGNGDGTFDLNLNNVQFVYSTSLIPTNGQVTVFAADLTKNGKIDAITSDFTTGTLQIALNAALGQGPPSAGIFSFALAPGISEVAAGDLNGDGVLDVVVINYSTSQITVLLSQKH